MDAVVIGLFSAGLGILFLCIHGILTDKKIKKMQEEIEELKKQIKK